MGRHRKSKTVTIDPDVCRLVEMRSGKDFSAKLEAVLREGLGIDILRIAEARPEEHPAGAGETQPSGHQSHSTDTVIDELRDLISRVDDLEQWREELPDVDRLEREVERLKALVEEKERELGDMSAIVKQHDEVLNSMTGATHHGNEQPT